MESVKVNFRKKMVKALLDIIALKYTGDNQRLGLYDFQEWLREKYGVSLSSGTVYSKIYGMERRGLVKGKEGEKKRTYLLTKKGEATLKSILSDTQADQFLILLEQSAV